MIWVQFEDYKQPKLFRESKTREVSILNFFSFFCFCRNAIRTNGSINSATLTTAEMNWADISVASWEREWSTDLNADVSVDLTATLRIPNYAIFSYIKDSYQHKKWIHPVPGDDAVWIKQQRVCVLILHSQGKCITTLICFLCFFLDLFLLPFVLWISFLLSGLVWNEIASPRERFRKLRASHTVIFILA